MESNGITRRRLIGTAATGAAVAALPASARAATSGPDPRYVSPSGNDLNDGLSLNRAFLTIQAAYDSLPAGSFTTQNYGGGVLVIAPGSYDVGRGLVLVGSKPVILQTPGGSSVLRRFGWYPSAADVRIFTTSTVDALVTIAMPDVAANNSYGFEFEGITFDLGTTAIYGVRGLSANKVFFEKCNAFGSEAGTGQAAYPQYLACSEVMPPNGNDASWWRFDKNQTYKMGLHKAGNFTTLTAQATLSGTYTLSVVPGGTAWAASSGTLNLGGGAQVITYTGKTTSSFTGCTGGSGTWPIGTAVGAPSAAIYPSNQHVWRDNFIFINARPHPALDLYGVRRSASFGNTIEGSQNGYTGGAIRLEQSKQNHFIADGGEAIPVFIRSVGVFNNNSNVFAPQGITNFTSGKVLISDDAAKRNAVVGNVRQQQYGEAISVTALKRANYAVLVTDKLVRCDSTAGGFTVTLPTASSAYGETHTVRNYGSSNTVTVASAGGSITGTTALTTGLAATYISDGTNWFQA
jgi:hypothetical protein